MKPIDPSLLVHVTAGGTDPVPWIINLPSIVWTLPLVTVVPGPMIGGFRP